MLRNVFRQILCSQRYQVIRHGKPTVNISDKHLRRLDKRFFDGRLNERLKTQTARRKVVLFSGTGYLATGFMVGYVVWSFMAPESASVVEKFLGALFWVFLVLVTQIEPLLVMSIRSAIAWPDQPFDERLQQLNADARSRVQPYILTAFILVFATALVLMTLLGAEYVSFAHPFYGGIPFYAGGGLALFIIAKNYIN